MEKLSLGEHLPPPEAAAPLFKVLNSLLLLQPQNIKKN